MNVQTKTKKITFPSQVFYVSEKKEIVKTLFQPGGTASGHFKVRKKGIAFYDLKGKICLFLASHDYAPFFVSACEIETSKGLKERFMFSTSSFDDGRLGLDKMRLLELNEFAQNTWNENKK